MESGAECGEDSPKRCVHVGRYERPVLGLEDPSVPTKYLTASNFVFSLEPNDESGANVDAAIMWRENREEFNKIARRIVRKTLGLPS